MKTNLRNALIIAAFAFSSLAQAQQDSQGAVQAVESLYSKIYAVGTSRAQDEATKQAAYCDIAASVDYSSLSDSLAGFMYNSSKPEHQQRFQTALKRMFASLLGQNFSTINFQRAYEVSTRVIKKSSGDVQVQTKLPFGETEVSNINFVMRNTSGQWLIIDALLKGTSLTSQKYPDFKEALDRLKNKYQDPINQYAVELEKTYPACQ